MTKGNNKQTTISLIINFIEMMMMRRKEEEKKMFPINNISIVNRIPKRTTKWYHNFNHNNLN